MIFVPKPYQQYTINRIISDDIKAFPGKEIFGCGPFLDMGLGKTASTLTAFIELKRLGKIKKALVIAPKKVAESVWTSECEKWDHLNGIQISQILGKESQRKKALLQKADLYIINRENISWLVALYGSNWPFDFVIVDESSSFKNPKSQRFKSLKLILPYVKRSVCLTGTPQPNGLLDLWSQIYILDRGFRLGDSFAKYRDKYFDAGMRQGYAVFNYNIRKGDKDLLGEDFYKKEIFDKISDICFSMKTEDYLDLPDRIDNDRVITLPKDVKEKYDQFEMEQVLKLKDKEITAINAVGLTNKLLQFSNGAIYDEDRVWHEVHNEKMEALDEILEELNGQPLLLFYNFISDRERILLKYKYAREYKKPQDEKDWNKGKIRLMVVHPKSAGHGLNLQFGGTNTLWFGCPWSLEEYQQGVKRVHRNGVSGIVTNTRLIVKDTMDEDVIKSLKNKDKNQSAMIEAVKARIKKYESLKK